MSEEKIVELEQRVARLEGWKEGTQSLLVSIRADLDDIKQRLTSLDQKIGMFRVELHGEIQELDKKFNRFFIWMIGIQFGIFLSMILLLLKLKI